MPEQQSVVIKQKSIYFIVDDDSKAVKIGVADFPEFRLQDLQVGNPHKLRLAKVIQNGSHKLEQELHRLFSDYVLGGEWYRLTKEIEDYLGDKHQDIQLDDEFRNFFPALAGEQKAGLEQDILAHGCLTPLILSGNTLLDGYHRYDICQRHDIPLETISLNFDSKLDALYWAFTHQKTRRNLSKYELAERALLFKPVIAAKAKEQQGMRTDILSESDKMFIAINTREELARTAGLAPETIYKVEFISEKADEKTKEKLREGELSIDKAYKESKQQQKRDDIRKVPQLPAGKYQVIYADPPWQYNNTGLGGSAENHYVTMSMAELLSMKDDIKSRAADNAVLFLWATSPFLLEGLELCHDWGFEYKTSFVWIKDRSTYGKLGFYNYGQHEFMFVATRGSCLPRAGTLAPSVLFAPKGKHSEKPEVVYDIIEKMYPNTNKLELFARQTRDGWIGWGNEVKGSS